MFDNEFCKVKYIEKANAVLLTWKKFCNGENYRDPTNYALELLKKFKNSSFIIDARKGFEDEEEDIAWGFNVLLPNMAKTTCTYCVIIMNEENDIESEMDIWTKEFMKYFTVIRTSTVKEALEMLKKSVGEEDVEKEIPDIYSSN